MGARLIIGVLTAFLAFAASARPCAAMLMSAPQHKSGHDCCDKSKGDAHHGQTPSECVVLCAMASAVYAAPTTITLEKPAALAPLFANAVAPAMRPVPSPRVDKTHRPPDHDPPLYVVNAAFLI